MNLKNLLDTITSNGLTTVLNQRKQSVEWINTLLNIKSTQSIFRKSGLNQALPKRLWELMKSKDIQTHFRDGLTSFMTEYVDPHITKTEYQEYCLLTLSNGYGVKLHFLYLPHEHTMVAPSVSDYFNKDRAFNKHVALKQEVRFAKGIYSFVEGLSEKDKNVVFYHPCPLNYGRNNHVFIQNEDKAYNDFHDGIYASKLIMSQIIKPNTKQSDVIMYLLAKLPDHIDIDGTPTSLLELKEKTTAFLHSEKYEKQNLTMYSGNQYNYQTNILQFYTRKMLDNIAVLNDKPMIKSFLRSSQMHHQNPILVFNTLLQLDNFQLETIWSLRLPIFGVWRSCTPQWLHQKSYLSQTDIVSVDDVNTLHHDETLQTNENLNNAVWHNPSKSATLMYLTNLANDDLRQKVIDCLNNPSSTVRETAWFNIVLPAIIANSNKELDLIKSWLMVWQCIRTIDISTSRTLRISGGVNPDKNEIVQLHPNTINALKPHYIRYFKQSWMQKITGVVLMDNLLPVKIRSLDAINRKTVYTFLNLFEYVFVSLLSNYSAEQLPKNLKELMLMCTFLRVYDAARLSLTQNEDTVVFALNDDCKAQIDHECIYRVAPPMNSKAMYQLLKGSDARFLRKKMMLSLKAQSDNKRREHNNKTQNDGSPKTPIIEQLYQYAHFYQTLIQEYCDFHNEFKHIMCRKTVSFDAVIHNIRAWMENSSKLDAFCRRMSYYQTLQKVDKWQSSNAISVQLDSPYFETMFEQHYQTSLNVCQFLWNKDTYSDQKFTATPLIYHQQMVDTGTLMNNCVATYYKQSLSLNFLLFQIESSTKENGKKEYVTVELSYHQDGFKIVQMEGQHRSFASLEAQNFIKSFVKELNKSFMTVENGKKMWNAFKKSNHELRTFIKETFTQDYRMQTIYQEYKHELQRQLGFKL